MPPKSKKTTLAALTPAKEVALQSIKESWNITHVSELFTDETKKTLKQWRQGPDDDFFEEDTLDLFQRLARLTQNRRDEVAKKLKERWSARKHNRGNGQHESADLKVGGNNAIKNENLRFDLKEFIACFETNEAQQREAGDFDSDDTSGGHAAGSSTLSKTASERSSVASESETKRKRNSDDGRQPPSRQLRLRSTKTATPKRTSASDGQPLPQKICSQTAKPTTRHHALEHKMDTEPTGDGSSSPSDAEDNELPSQMMLARIRAYWMLRSIFDILPAHSFDPRARPQSAPFRDYPRLLRAIFKLATATRGRATEVEDAFAQAFEAEKEFSEDVAVWRIRRLARRFAKGMQKVTWTRAYREDEHGSDGDVDEEDADSDGEYHDGSKARNDARRAPRIKRQRNSTGAGSSNQPGLPAAELRDSTISDDASDRPTSASPRPNVHVTPADRNTTPDSPSYTLPAPTMTHSFEMSRSSS